MRRKGQTLLYLFGHHCGDLTASKAYSQPEPVYGYSFMIRRAGTISNTGLKRMASCGLCLYSMQKHSVKPTKKGVMERKLSGRGFSALDYWMQNIIKLLINDRYCFPAGTKKSSDGSPNPAIDRFISRSLLLVCRKPSKSLYRLVVEEGKPVSVR